MGLFFRKKQKKKVFFSENQLFLPFFSFTHDVPNKWSLFLLLLQKDKT